MPPPKLVAPMTRKVQKIEASDTRPAGPPSLMVAWCRLAQAVDDPGLRHAECEPVARRGQQPLVERIGPLARLHVHVLVALELALVGELPHERRADDARPPP